MHDVKWLRKRLKKKDEKINWGKIEKKGIISTKKRMRNAILIVFFIANILIRTNSLDSV